MVQVHGLTEDVLFDTEDYSNFIGVDIRDLKSYHTDNDADVTPFFIDNRHNSVNSISFDQYYGFVYFAQIPNGVLAKKVQELCDSIAENTELTEGFGSKWNGQNYIAVWKDSDDEEIRCTEDSEGYDFWSNGFGEAVAELDDIEVYDMSDYDSIDYVQEVVEAHTPKPESLSDVEKILKKDYSNEDGAECYFVGFSAAAEIIWERLQEKENDE